MSDPDVAIFDLAYVPNLLVRALELLSAVEECDEALLPEDVVEQAQAFRAVLDEVNEVV